jgi:hypothetical protein
MIAWIIRMSAWIDGQSHVARGMKDRGLVGGALLQVRPVSPRGQARQGGSGVEWKRQTVRRTAPIITQLVNMPKVPEAPQGA